jgi:hypothetical protein
MMIIIDWQYKTSDSVYELNLPVYSFVFYNAVCLASMSTE